jgi:uncharacterized repeat protein (TIGR03803 family)
MKKILLSIICFLACILTLQAQILYSSTKSGGSGGAGTISKFIPATNTLTVIKSFISNDVTDGSSPTGSLMQAADGKLYGMTQFGGSSGVGVIFSFDPSSGTYTKLKDFDGTNGASPDGNSLVQASDGKLYGMTYAGGIKDNGVIFCYDISSFTYTKLFDFDSTNGEFPHGSLIQASDGKLYGLTLVGGLPFNNCQCGDVGEAGVIFSYDIFTNTFTKLRNFGLGSGIYPYGSLVQAKDGKLYGMTSRGGFIDFKGDLGLGVIFSFDPSSSVYTVLLDFDPLTGSGPSGNLIQTSDGKFYGMATFGGNNEGSDAFGVIFSFDATTSVYTTLKGFGNTDGAKPLGNLMQATDGRFYGMTQFGGSSGVGVIFSLDPSSSAYTKLIDYDGANGANPGLGSGFIEVKECIAGTTYFQDADGDGYGNPNISVQACTQPAGYVTDNTDCDDNNAAIHTPVTYYRDADGDGFGDPNTSIRVCAITPPAGYVNNNYDCDDHNTAKKAENEKVLMCHNGKPQCVIAKEIRKKLDNGWTLGPCTSATSGTTIADAENVDIYSKEQAIPRQYKLSNYPNPFIGRSTIKYELPLDSKVSIKVYDIMGRMVATLVNGNKKAGTYTIDFNAGHVSRGSLYYRIIATSKDKQFKQTNKMIQIQ